MKKYFFILVLAILPMVAGIKMAHAYLAPQDIVVVFFWTTKCDYRDWPKKVTGGGGDGVHNWFPGVFLHNGWKVTKFNFSDANCHWDDQDDTSEDGGRGAKVLGGFSLLMPDPTDPTNTGANKMVDFPAGPAIGGSTLSFSVRWRANGDSALSIIGKVITNPANLLYLTPAGYTGALIPAGASITALDGALVLNPADVIDTVEDISNKLRDYGYGGTIVLRGPHGTMPCDGSCGFFTKVEDTEWDFDDAYVIFMPAFEEFDSRSREPNNLHLSAPSANQIKISWTNPFNDDNFTKYVVYRSIGTDDNASREAFDAGTEWEYLDDTVLPNTHYCYRVASVFGNSIEFVAPAAVCHITSGGATAYIPETETVTARTSTKPPAEPTGFFGKLFSPVYKVFSFVRPRVDTTPPTAPANVKATAISSNSIVLSWTASRDNVGVTGYAVTLNGVESISSLPSNAISYTHNNLKPATSYCYVIRAYDVAGFTSESDKVCAVTLFIKKSVPIKPALALTVLPSKPVANKTRDVKPPITPANIKAVVVSPSRIDLSWTASTDPSTGSAGSPQSSGVAGYTVTPVGTNNFFYTVTNSYSHIGLIADKNYCYLVHAYDAAGNTSSASVETCATTASAQPVAELPIEPTGFFSKLFAPVYRIFVKPEEEKPKVDITAPTIPANVIATAVSSTQINLSWTASKDNVGVAGYKVAPIGKVGTFTATNNNYSHTGLIAGTRYCYVVNAYDVVGNNSAFSAQVCATTASLAPTVETALPPAPVRAPVALPPALTPTPPTVAPAPISPMPPSTTITLIKDTTSPSIPTNVKAVAVSSSRIDISWTASTDPSTGSAGSPQASGVAGYTVQAIVGSGNGIIYYAKENHYSHTGLVAGTRYCYIIRAYDAPGNTSGASAQVCASTASVLPVAETVLPTAPVSDTTAIEIVPTLLPPPPTITAEPTPPSIDITSPSTPTNVSATAISSTQINLSWTASTDNVGVAGYKIYATDHDPVQVNTNSYFYTGLTAGKEYCYTLSAFDAAGNDSALSTSISSVCATTKSVPDTQAPTLPTNLTAAVQSSSVINLSWAASTDNVSVQGYKLTAYSNGTLSGVYTVTNTSYSHTSLTSATQYCYQVFSYDSAGNNSVQTSQVCATTQSAISPPPPPPPPPPSSVDTTAPTIPTNLVATAVSTNRIDLTWPAPSDNVGVTGYTLYRGGNYPGSASLIDIKINAYSDIPLLNGTPYWYDVVAYDAAGNRSGHSAQVRQTTGGYDDMSPSAQTNITVSANADHKIYVNWSASTDNVAVQGYRIFRNSAIYINVSANPQTYIDSSVTVGTQYCYQVAAYDGYLYGIKNTPAVCAIAK